LEDARKSLQARPSLSSCRRTVIASEACARGTRAATWRQSCGRMRSAVVVAVSWGGSAFSGGVLRTALRLWQRPWWMLEARGEPQEPDRHGRSRAPGERGLRVHGAKHAGPRPPLQSEEARNAPVVGM